MQSQFLQKLISVKLITCLLVSLVGTLIVAPAITLAAACPSADATITISTNTTWTTSDASGFNCAGQNIVITNNATLTLTGNTATGDIPYIDAANITIDSGSAISANGNGCEPLNADFNANGKAPNGDNICIQTSGGSPVGGGEGNDGGWGAAGGGGYGGAGGNGAGTGTGGSFYGDADAPELFGAAGGTSGTLGLGGNGGGVVKLNVNGTLTNNGAITANGANGVVTGGSTFGEDSAGAGGSGGSIFLSMLRYVCATGTLTTSGGQGETYTTGMTIGSGSGGGGRVRAGYGISDSGACALSTLLASTVAAGGPAGPFPGSNGSPGSAGTLSVAALKLITFTAATASTTEGNSGTTNTNIEITLASASVGSTTVDYTVTGTATGSGTDYTLANGTATITDGNTTTNVTLSVVGDTDVEVDETVIITLSNATNGSIVNTEGNYIHTHTISNDDVANVAPTVGSETVDTVAVASQTSSTLLPLIGWTYADDDLDTQASYQVVIAPSGGLSVYDSGVVASASASHQVVTGNFTTGTALEPSTVYDLTVTVNDGTTDTAGTTVQFTTKAAGVTTDTSGGIAVTEGSTTDTFTMVLDTIPTGDVVLTFTDDGAVSMSPTSLTFTSANWDTPQTVTVTAVDNAVVDGSRTSTTTVAATSADGSYNGISVSSISASVTDNDVAATGGGGGSISYLLNLPPPTTPATIMDLPPTDVPADVPEEQTPAEQTPTVAPTADLDQHGATGDFAPSGVNDVPSGFRAFISPAPILRVPVSVADIIIPEPIQREADTKLFVSLMNFEPPAAGTKIASDNGFENMIGAFRKFKLEKEKTGTKMSIMDIGDDDGDGIQNGLERLLGTSIADRDSDGDGVDDGTEINFYGTDPMVKNVGIMDIMNVNYPKTLSTSAQLPVVAPSGSKVRVYYVTKDGKKVFLNTITTGPNNVGLVDLVDLPNGEVVQLLTEIVTPDNQSREILSDPFRVRLSRLTAETAIVYIDGNRVRDFSKTYIIKNSHAVIEGRIPTFAARWNIASLVFGSVILTDSKAGAVSTAIPVEILKDPSVHKATLLAYDPETSEYSDPVSISFVYKPNRLFPNLAKGQLNIFDPAVTFLILLVLAALAASAAGVLKYQHRKEHTELQTKSRS